MGNFCLSNEEFFYNSKGILRRSKGMLFTTLCNLIIFLFVLGLAWLLLKEKVD